MDQKKTANTTIIMLISLGITGLYFSSRPSIDKARVLEEKIKRQKKEHQELFHKAEKAADAIIESKKQEIEELKKAKETALKNQNSSRKEKEQVEQQYNNVLKKLGAQKSKAQEEKRKLISDFQKKKEKNSMESKKKLQQFIKEKEKMIASRKEVEKQLKDLLNAGKIKLCLRFNEQKNCIEEKEYQMPQDAQKYVMDQKQAKEKEIEDLKKQRAELENELKKHPEREKEIKPKLEEVKKKIQEKENDLGKLLKLALALSAAFAFPPKILIAILAGLEGFGFGSSGSGTNTAMGKGEDHGDQQTTSNEKQRTDPQSAPSAPKNTVPKHTQTSSPHGTKSKNNATQENILRLSSNGDLLHGNIEKGKVSARLAKLLKKSAQSIVKMSGSNYVIQWGNFCREIYIDGSEWKLSESDRLCSK